MSIKTITKGPLDRLPVFFDWTAWLAGETAQLRAPVSIVSVEWSTKGVTLVRDRQPTYANKVASAWIEGGPGSIACTVTTSHGHVATRAMNVGID